MCKSKKSKHKGIHYASNVSKWGAVLYMNNKQKFLGYFKTEEQAFNALNEKKLNIINISN